MKLLTIIIPSYNMEEYIGDCLQSLIIDDDNQMSKLDIIVVNDGSKDRTSEIAHDYANKYPDSIRVVDKGNGHYGSCINSGLAIANGKFIKVLDADDSFASTNFVEFIEFLTNHSDVDLVTSDYDIVNEKGDVTERIKLPYPDDKVFGLKEMVSSGHELIMHGVAYRTSILTGIGYRQTEGCVFTDTEWMFRPMLEVKTAVRFAKPVYRYLVGRAGQSVSVEMAVKLLPVQKRIFGIICAVYEEMSSKVAEEYKQYMILYLSRIYRIIFGVYFLRMPIKSLKNEFWAFYKEVVRKVPEATEIRGAFGIVFAGHTFQVNCASLWFKSRGENLLWPMAYRVYYYIRKPSRISELFK